MLISQKIKNNFEVNKAYYISAYLDFNTLILKLSY